MSCNRFKRRNRALEHVNDGARTGLEVYERESLLLNPIRGTAREIHFRLPESSSDLSSTDEESDKASRVSVDLDSSLEAQDAS